MDALFWLLLAAFIVRRYVLWRRELSRPYGDTDIKGLYGFSDHSDDDFGLDLRSDDPLLTDPVYAFLPGNIYHDMLHKPHDASCDADHYGTGLPDDLN